MRLIETSHLKTWAGTKIAESRFPHLVKELITAVVYPTKLRFPSGDAVWVPGFDGIVVSNEDIRFVPTGGSVWEVGTSINYKEKASNDYSKRTESISLSKSDRLTIQDFEPSQITFVFVTPLIWSDKEVWIMERKDEGIWKDIWVIDGVDLQGWIEEAPAVSLQFGAELGIVPEVGLQTLDQAWEEWSHLTEPPISEELVVIGREEQENELKNQLLNEPCTLIIRGDSPREAWGFALAVMRRMGVGSERTSIESRTIIAENEQVARRLINLKNLIIVLKQSTGQMSGQLAAHGFHVIVPQGNDDRSVRNVIILTRPTGHLFVEALGKMGFAEDESKRIARGCGYNITILQRKLAHANFVLPLWVNNPNLNKVFPALLAGRWNSQNKADTEIICQLAGITDYATYESELQPLLWVDEAPIRKLENMWMLTAPADTFHLVARYFRQVDLDRFRKAFLEVFSKIDPKVEVPPDEWIYIDLNGDYSGRHSSWLKSGMAETLLLIAEHGDNAQLKCILYPRSYAENIVSELPGLGSDWRILASLRDQYALLMEAAPDPFLHFLEELIEDHSQEVRNLFVEGHAPFSGGSMHVGLLRGLEIMAWDPKYLQRVTLLLAQLASIDPGGKISNRPINSLRNIFLSWYPCTNASIDEKLSVIDSVLLHYPEIGWQLLADLLPKSRQSVTWGTTTSRWRDLGEIPEEARSHSGSFRYNTAIIDRAINNVGLDPKRWRDLIYSMSTFNLSDQERILQLLETLSSIDFQGLRKAELWQILREFAYQNRAYEGTGWRLNKSILERIEAVLSHLASDDPVERYHWLFDDWLTEPISENRDENTGLESVDVSRGKAIREIIAKTGVDGVVRLGSTSKLPVFVASASVEVIYDLDLISNILKKAISSGEIGLVFASYLSGEAQKRHGDLWRDRFLVIAIEEHWTPEIIAELLIQWQDQKSTWDVVSMLGVTKEYWSRKQIFALQGTQEDKIYQIENLIKAGRAHRIIRSLLIGAKDIPTEILLKVLDSFLIEVSSVVTEEQLVGLQIDPHYIKQILGELRTRSDLAREDLARREYSLIAIIGYQGLHGLTIQELMAETPTLFVDLLCAAFLPHNRDKAEVVEANAKTIASSSAAFLLLRGMNNIPGMNIDGSIDEKVLLDWIKEVRRIAVEKDRSIIADQHIGQILAHVPPDPEDSAWPHQVIRNVVEKIGAQQIERGLITERLNMRGVYSKALYEGGKQERALAAEYEQWAGVVGIKWPRTAQVLEKIAQTWKENARREDVEAERDKLE